MRFSIDSIFWCCCSVSVAGSASRGFLGDAVRAPRGVVVRGEGTRGDTKVDRSHTRGETFARPRRGEPAPSIRGDARRVGDGGASWTNAVADAVRGVICGEVTL
jgi:hypothetical protein